MIVNTIGIWKSHLLAGILLCSGSIATAYATEFWHCVISYGFLKGKINTDSKAFS